MLAKWKRPRTCSGHHCKDQTDRLFYLRFWFILSWGIITITCRNKIRSYKPCIINFQAKSVDELIDLSLGETEPPLTRHLTNNELLDIRKNPYKPPPYELVSQACERAVQETSKIVSVVIEIQMQDGFVMDKIEAKKRHQDTLSNINWCIIKLV